MQIELNPSRSGKEYMQGYVEDIAFRQIEKEDYKGQILANLITTLVEKGVIDLDDFGNIVGLHGYIISRI